MRKSGFVLAASAAVIAWVQLPLAAQSKPSPQVRAAEILTVAGTVELQRGSGTPWTVVRTGQELRESDRLRTGGFSHALLKFDVGGQWQLSPESQLNLQEALAGPSSTVIVRLERGGAVMRWTPDRRTTSAKLAVQTPSGRANITGTEWSMRVDDDGRTALAVLEGQVELSNDRGLLVVHQNETAEMRVGEAPSILRVVSSKDRVQWVAAYAASPARYAALATGAAKAVLDDVTSAVLLGRVAEAVAAIDAALIREPDANMSLALVDLLIGAGDFERARTAALAGQLRHPEEARFDAMLARIALFEGQPDESRAAADRATSKAPRVVDGWLARGDWAIQGGEGAIARFAFAEATRVAPTNPAAWFGLGRVSSEREAYADAKAELTRALSLDPSGLGYRGELGTLETRANQLPAARREYAQALAAQPNDYVALTGRALLALKEGKDAAAVELLLRATLLEPRYARARVYLGVAYYRMRRVEDAKKELARAIAIDTRDPLPHVMLTQIHADAFEPGQAIRDARAAAVRMPYLKSFNQLATTVKGSANLGSAFAALGLEERAQHMAHESHDPFWAGSALFLGDRYRTSFMRESAYGRGILTDPMVLGTSTVSQTLLPRPGVHVTASSAVSKQATSEIVGEPSIVINGYSTLGAGVSYLVTASRAKIDFPEPAPFSLYLPAYTAAVGVNLTPTWSLLATASRDTPHGSSPFTNADGMSLPATVRLSTTRGDLGFRRRTPTSLVLASASVTRDAFDYEGEGVSITSPVSSTLGRLVGYQLLGRSHVAAFGAEAYKIDGVATLVLDSSRIPSEPFRYWLTRAFASDTFRLAPAVTLQGGLVVTRQGGGSGRLEGTVIEPRVGVAVRGQGAVLRGSYIEWTKGQEVSTFAPLTTAGVPLDDRTMQGAGRLKQTTAQFEWEASDRLYAQAAVRKGRQLSAYEDTARGLRAAVVPGGFDPSMRVGQTLRAANGVSLGNGQQPGDEGVTSEPLIGSWLTQQNMTFTLANGAVNYLFSDTTSVVVRGERWVIKDATPSPVTLIDVAAGFTWVSRRHWLAQAVTSYQGGTLTRIVTTGENATSLNVHGWRMRGTFGWETSDKRWSAQFAGSVPLRHREAVAAAPDVRTSYASLVLMVRY